MALAGDVQDEDYARSLVKLAAREFGGLDIAFNNAATMGVLGGIAEMSRQNWTTTIETNLTGAFLGANIKYQRCRCGAAARSSLHRPLSVTRSGFREPSRKQGRPNRHDTGSCCRARPFVFT